MKYRKIDQNSCESTILEQDGQFVRTIAIPEGDDEACCYANGPRTFYENKDHQAQLLNPYKALCNDGEKSSLESDTDCGGKFCSKCLGGQICKSKEKLFLSFFASSE